MVLRFKPVLLATSEMRSLSRPMRVDRWQRIIFWLFLRGGVAQRNKKLFCAQPSVKNLTLLYVSDWLDFEIDDKFEGVRRAIPHRFMGR